MAAVPLNNNETQMMELEYVRLTTVKMRRCGDNRKRLAASSPLITDTSESVMSLPVSYEVKACHYHDSIILTLPAKLQGAAKGKRRGQGAGGREGARRRRRLGHEIFRRIPFNIG